MVPPSEGQRGIRRVRGEIHLPQAMVDVVGSETRGDLRQQRILFNGAGCAGEDTHAPGCNTFQALGRDFQCRLPIGLAP